MNRKEIKEMLPVIQAFADGKIIEGRVVGIINWTETEELSTDLYEGHKIECRVKSNAKFDPRMLKPFDRILVRNSCIDNWGCSFFSNHRKDELFPFLTCDASAIKYCIPYNEETKHLVGTTDEAPEFYKYWEN